MKDILRMIVPGSIRSAARRTYSRLLLPKNTMPDACQSLAVLMCSIAYNRYGGYCVPDSSRDRPAAQKILHGGVYEPDMIEFLMSHCGNGDIVHAGTYFGDFLPALSEACTPGAKIWAFEPNPENYRCACITLLLNDIENIALENAGLGESPDTLLVRTKDEYGRSLGGGSQIVTSGYASSNGGLEEVRIVTIDSVVPQDRDVSIIQLDVEGYEKQALGGAMKTIHRCRPIIVLEVLPGSNLLESDWFNENIISLGYRYLESRHGNDILVPETGW